MVWIDEGFGGNGGSGGAGGVVEVALGGEAAAVEVGEGGFVGSDHAGAGTGFDAHVADRHAAFHGEGADGGAGVLDDVAGGAVGADAADDVEDDVLSGDAEGEVTFDVDAECFWLVLRQGLGGEDVLDLAGADAEGEGSEGPVGGGVGVSADDGHAGLGEAELGADDVDDALVGGLDIVEFDTEVVTIAAEGVDLFGGDLVGDEQAVLDAGCGDVVVDGGDGAIGAADFAIGEAEAFEGLGAGDLVDEVEVDVEDGRLVGGFGDEVLVPDFFEHGAGRAVWCAHGFAFGAASWVGVGEPVVVSAGRSLWAPTAEGARGVGGAVGVDEKDAGDVLERGGTGGGLGGPAADATDEGSGDMGGVEGLAGEEPEGVGGGLVVGGSVLGDPVDGGEGDERVGEAEVDPEEAAIGAEVLDAAVGGEIAVVFAEDVAGDGEEVEGDFGEGLGFAPEALGGGEVLFEEGLEARILDEGVLVAVWGGLGVVPEPGEVFGGVVAVEVDLGGVDLGERGRGCEEEECGELEGEVHWLFR